MTTPKHVSGTVKLNHVIGLIEYHITDDDDRMALKNATRGLANSNTLSADQLAQIIRDVDGENTLGAGELAERILNALGD